MRYPKGSLQLNESRDLPLLRQVLHSEYVTHSQLFEFARLNHHERSRKSFDWRLRRLVHGGLVNRQTRPTCSGEFVYSIARSAATMLQGMGEYCLVGRERAKAREVEPSVLHAIGLNDIHLTVLRTGMLVRWASSIEIRSQNELTGFGFAKDYDAIVTVRIDGEDCRFALEYERSPKAAKYYNDLSASLCHEARVNRVLYLITNYDLLRFVSAFFKDEYPQVLFGLVKEWHALLLDMPVSDGCGKRPISLREAVRGAGVEVEVAPN
jgi:Replication-relaxation